MKWEGKKNLNGNRHKAVLSSTCVYVCVCAYMYTHTRTHTHKQSMFPLRRVWSQHRYHDSCRHGKSCALHRALWRNMAIKASGIYPDTIPADGSVLGKGIFQKCSVVPTGAQPGLSSLRKDLMSWLKGCCDICSGLHGEYWASQSIIFSSHKIWRIKKMYGELLKNHWFHLFCFLFLFLIISNLMLFQSNL